MIKNLDAYFGLKVEENTFQRKRQKKYYKKKKHDRLKFRLKKRFRPVRTDAGRNTGFPDRYGWKQA